ncbi:hypothetical protein [Azospirillum picis]|uniref:Uncharacterized protein n=1 Tax=Azospirillum picis TaxID=488438 RepID=A0ABU0MUR8_9PROT|nr:hypothetical protein [Azospirillum picis]MBP2303379.1 hypothetical protein [Azospirillum picis]MDQ0537220.1 hypothetical protein [Azospirillum picis]
MAWIEDRGDPVERLAAHSPYGDLVVAERGNPGPRRPGLPEPSRETRGGRGDARPSTARRHFAGLL